CAEPQHHAELVGLDAEEAGKQPDGDRGQHDQAEPLATEAAARQHRAQLVLATAQKLLEVGGRRARRLLPRAPRALTSAARSPRPAALIAPRHRLSPRCIGPKAGAPLSIWWGYRGCVIALQRGSSACGATAHGLELPVSAYHPPARAVHTRGWRNSLRHRVRRDARSVPFPAKSPDRWPEISHRRPA